MKRCTILVLAVLLVAAPAWAASGLVVKTSKGFATEIEVKVPEISLSKVQVLGNPAVEVTIPNGSVSFEKDAPALPRLTAMVAVDPVSQPVVKVTPVQSEIVNLDANVVPSKGNLLRSVDPETVPYKFGAAYAKDQWIPSDKELVVVGEPFILRDLRGINLTVNPVQYNPVKNQLRIHRQMKVSVSVGDRIGANVSRKPAGISKVFEPIYKNVFINFEGATKRLPRLEENGRLLVICYDDFVDAIAPFVAWKKKIGLNVVVAKSSEAGKTPDEIKAFIQKEFDKGGLTHIMLVGDAEQIPTLKGVKERADSDPSYTKLAGGDHVPDCIISRLSATNAKEVAYQVAKFVNYEQFPTMNDKAWYTNAMGIASNQGNPTDFARCEELRKALEAWNFKKIDQIYDPKATKAMIAAGVNEGRSLINYIGHGSTTSWGTTGYSNTDCAALANGWKMPLIWSVACVNGAFVAKTCFCEAWMRAGDIEKPAGAVAIFGASTNMEWVPPCIVQDEINKVLTVTEAYKTAGGLFFNGLIKGCEVYGVEPTGSGIMMVEQWHHFGDGTMLVRFKEPVAVAAKTEATKTADGVTVKVFVTDGDNKPVSNARVVVYTEGVEKSVVGTTNVEGAATLTLNQVQAAEGYLTVIGADVAPLVDQKVSF